MDWYPWYVSDFRRDTLHLSLAEDGAYRRLIDEYMMLRGPLPNDDRALARIVGVDLSEWMAVAERVRSFFQSKKGVLHHKRCDQELNAQAVRKNRFSERGKKAAFAKYSKPNGLDARRMLISPTIQYISKITSSESVAGAVRTFDEENVERPRMKTKAPAVASSELAETVKRRGWS